MKVIELRQKRAGLIAEARKIIDAGEPGKPLAAEAETRYNAIMDEVNNLAKQIERQERQEQMERELAESAGRETHDGAPGTGAPGGASADSAPAPYQFQSRGMLGMTVERMQADPQWARLLPFMQPNYQGAYRHFLLTGEVRALARAEESRALQADVDTAGGYLVTPVQFVDALIKAVDNLVYVRQWATVYAVANADALGVPSLDHDPADPTWTSELLIGSEDSTMDVGARELHPHPLAKYIKVSRKLLRKVPSVEQLVMDRFAYKFAVVAENAYLNGKGAGEPLGVFTASNSGISTGRDVSTGNTTTSIQFDGLVEAKYTLKPQYWPRARWMFHRDGVKQIAKLQDDDGQYIWRESVRVGEPDTLLGFPVAMSEYAPSTFTTGLYVGLLGDWSYYWIADAMSFEMQRLVELYAATNQIGYIGRLESDGQPVLEEAFVRVKLA